MKIISLVALLAAGACCALGFEVAAPPQLQAAGSPMDASRARVREQLKEAISVAALTAPATAGISTNFFNRILADVDAFINSIGTSIVIPGESQKHFGFDPIHFQQFQIGSMTVATSAPNKIVVNIDNVGITIPETSFHVKADKLLHCAGKFSVQVEGGNFAITLTMGGDGVGHITTVAAITTSYTKIDVKHKFDHFFCKIANDIINDFIVNIDKLIDKVIKEDLPALLAPAMTKAFDALFAKIPLYFTAAPAVAGAGLSVTVDLLASTAAFPTAAPYPQRLQQLRDYSHDITIDVPASSMNNIMIVAQQANKLDVKLDLKETTKFFKSLIPAAYTACPDCKLSLDFDLMAAPFVTFAADDIDATANNVNVAISAINNVTNAIVPLFTININVALDVNNVTVRTINNASNLYFQLAVQNLAITLGTSNIGPLPLIDVIGGILSSLIKDLAIPAFNGIFAGVDFPALFGGVQVTALAGIFEFESNILLPPIS